jgi:hypothetical protein
MKGSKMYPQAYAKRRLAQRASQFLCWVTAGSVRWGRIFGKDAPQPPWAIIEHSRGHARCTCPSGRTRAEIDQVLQHLGMLDSTQFPLLLRNTLGTLFDET